MEYTRCALVECSFAAFAEGPDREKRKRAERGGESLSSERVGGEEARGGEDRRDVDWREDSAGRRGWSMKDRGGRATLLENKAGFSP